MKVSVIIPTCNGGNILVEAIKSLIQQQFSQKWEIVLIDSESTDVSLSKISTLISKNSIKHKVISIIRKNFKHGTTRNQAISQCSGEFIALLTQDSIPTDKYWLQQLINGFDRDEVAGVFGEHKAHKCHPKIIDRDLRRHFHLMSQTKYRTSREWFASKHDLQKQQLLHFFRIITLLYENLFGTTSGFLPSISERTKHGLGLFSRLDIQLSISLVQKYIIPINSGCLIPTKEQRPKKLTLENILDTKSMEKKKRSFLNFVTKFTATQAIQFRRKSFRYAI